MEISSHAGFNNPKDHGRLVQVTSADNLELRGGLHEQAREKRWRIISAYLRVSG